MSEQMFDTDSFLNTSTEGEMSTEFPVVPAGDFNAVVDDIDVRSGEGEKGTWAVMDITWVIDDAAVAEEMGIDNPKCRQSIFLDFDDSGALKLGKGKNVGLGRLREALGQNGPGAWSPAMLKGGVARVHVEQRIHEGKTYADVKYAVKL